MKNYLEFSEVSTFETVDFSKVKVGDFVNMEMSNRVSEDSYFCRITSIDENGFSIMEDDEEITWSFEDFSGPVNLAKF